MRCAFCNLEVTEVEVGGREGIALRAEVGGHHGSRFFCPGEVERRHALVDLNRLRRQDDARKAEARARWEADRRRHRLVVETASGTSYVAEVDDSLRGTLTRHGSEPTFDSGEVDFTLEGSFLAFPHPGNPLKFLHGGGVLRSTPVVTWSAEPACPRPGTLGARMAEAEVEAVYALEAQADAEADEWPVRDPKTGVTPLPDSPYYA
jgi:hypothetical protein